MFNITNNFEHPTRPGYFVFRFREKVRADYFEELLKKEGVWFEKSEEDDESPLILYGIKLNDYKKATKANYMVSAKYRKKTISSIYLRIIIYAVAVTIISLAIIGALSKT